MSCLRSSRSYCESRCKRNRMSYFTSQCDAMASKTWPMISEPEQIVPIGSNGQPSRSLGKSSRSVRMQRAHASSMQGGNLSNHLWMASSTGLRAITSVSWGGFTCSAETAASRCLREIILLLNTIISHVCNPE